MRNSILGFMSGGACALSMVAGLIITSPTLSVAQDAGGSGECEDSNYSEAVLGYEGGGDPYATNPSSTATGSYQFLFGTLVDLGYISPGQSTPPAGAGNWSGIVWTGKDGVYSRDQFMSSSSAQDNALAEFTNKNLASVSGSYTAGQVVNGVPLSNGGVALATHMLGAGGFQKWAASGFSASGLDADIAAAHGWTQEEYLNHLMGRVAAGGCYDPSMIDSSGSGELTQDLPEIFLMPWEPAYKVPPILPGTITSAR
ncbi:hypothetical protein KUV57_12835 [Epibacterium sp. DP7N7-1]|nr:hypothetical protein [Epibacterium sp. DP7N7-1]